MWTAATTRKTTLITMPPKELGMVLRLDTNSIHRLTDLTKLA